jgi:hypothetical protein
MQLLERFVRDASRNPLSHNPATDALQPNPAFGKRLHLLHRCYRPLDGEACVLEWKTSSVRYPDEPFGIVALDKVYKSQVPVIEQAPSRLLP